MVPLGLHLGDGGNPLERQVHHRGRHRQLLRFLRLGAHHPVEGNGGHRPVGKAVDPGLKGLDGAHGMESLGRQFLAKRPLGAGLGQERLQRKDVSSRALEEDTHRPGGLLDGVPQRPGKVGVDGRVLGSHRHRVASEAHHHRQGRTVVAIDPDHARIPIDRTIGVPPQDGVQRPHRPLHALNPLTPVHRQPLNLRAGRADSHRHGVLRRYPGG